MADINNTITCIKCNGPVWKFGKDPDTGLQKYRCKNPSCFVASLATGIGGVTSAANAKVSDGASRR